MGTGELEDHLAGAIAGGGVIPTRTGDGTGAAGGAFIAGAWASEVPGFAAGAAECGSCFREFSCSPRALLSAASVVLL